MKNCIILILISAFLIKESNQYCEESRRLESTCGGYCFNAVKPILDHTKMLQSRVDNVENIERKNNLDKLNNIEQLFNEKFQALDKTIREEVQKLQTMKPGYMQQFEKIGSKYYYIDHDHGMNWFAAVHKCHELGGHLVNLQNQEEFDAVIKKLKHRFYWIDINDLAKEGEYYSLTTGLKASFLKWYSPDEPNNRNKNEHCVQLREVNGDYTMNDDHCDDDCLMICEREFN